MLFEKKHSLCIMFVMLRINIIYNMSLKCINKYKLCKLFHSEAQDIDIIDRIKKLSRFILLSNLVYIYMKSYFLVIWFICIQKQHISKWFD